MQTFMIAAQVTLFLVNLHLLRKNKGIVREIRRCNYDLGVALEFARQGKYDEAKQAVRQWAVRMRAHCAGEPPPRPEPAPQREWRFAP